MLASGCDADAAGGKPPMRVLRLDQLAQMLPFPPPPFLSMPLLMPLQRSQMSELDLLAMKRATPYLRPCYSSSHSVDKVNSTSNSISNRIWINGFRF